MLEVRRIGAILGHRRPFVFQNDRIRLPGVYHRFHRQHHALFEPRILVLAVHIIGDLRLFMELRSDAVAHILPYN